MLEGFSGIESQADIQLMPPRAIDGDSSMALDSIPPPEHPSDTLWSHIQRLCSHDFRAEPWYLDNLFLIMSYFAMAACFILIVQSPGWGNYGRMSLLLELVLGLSAGGIVIPGAIPLCGIVSGIQRRGKRSPFLIKLAVDSGNRYRMSRWIFCLWALISGIAFAVGFYTLGDIGSEFGSCAILWISVWGIISFYAVFRGLFSIYSQVLAHNRPRDYT